MIWYFRSPDGVGSHPTVAMPGMGMAIPLTALMLLTIGGALVAAWLFV